MPAGGGGGAGRDPGRGGGFRLPLRRSDGFTGFISSAEGYDVWVKHMYKMNTPINIPNSPPHSQTTKYSESIKPIMPPLLLEHESLALLGIVEEP